MLRNQVQLIGNLGKDPEVKNLESGKIMATLRMATNEFYTDAKGDRIEKTQWHHVVAWGNNAKVIEKYLRKGSEVAIQGKLVHRSYDDKDGQKKYVTEVVANELVLMGKAEQAA